MRKQKRSGWRRPGWIRFDRLRALAAGLAMALGMALGTGAMGGALQAQTTPQTPPAPAPAKPTPKTEQTRRMTPQQAEQLFRSVDSILQFDSKDTLLPIRHAVQRRLVTRDQVERYLLDQLQDDRDAKRLQRSELVLKKFGLLDRDFELQPFLVKLLREQIAGYYNDKTKTVNLLDWIPPEEQKPVLAHELTHALQDQYIHLEKWDQQSDLSIAKDVQQDNRHLATDEADTVRDAVVEGQAMAVFIDYALAPTGKNLLTAPEVVERMDQTMSDNSDSPTLATAPLLLQRSLLFPYADGLRFVRAVLLARGTRAAFAGLLDHPPTSTYEIMTPSVYLKHRPVPLLRMPDIHPLLGSQYRPYDIGVMGELDVQMVTELFGGRKVSKALTPAWRGGVYYTAQKKNVPTATQSQALASLALMYLSRWATPQAAQSFASMYGRQIPRQFDGVTQQPAETTSVGNQTVTSNVWQTSEGPVLIVVSGRTVFLSESFPLDLARKLQLVMMGSIADSAGSEVVEMPRQPAPRELTAGLEQTLAALGVALPAGQNPTGAAARALPGKAKPRNARHAAPGWHAIY